MQKTSPSTNIASRLIAITRDTARSFCSIEEKLIPNTTIIEYDLQSASTSIAAEFGLLSDEMIARFNKLPKGDRNRAIVFE